MSRVKQQRAVDRPFAEAYVSMLFGSNASVGTINGIVAMNATVYHLAAFFDVVLKGKKWSSLLAPDATYPEVSVARPRPGE